MDVQRLYAHISPLYSTWRPAQAMVDLRRSCRLNCVPKLPKTYTIVFVMEPTEYIFYTGAIKSAIMIFKRLLRRNIESYKLVERAILSPRH